MKHPTRLGIGLFLLILLTPLGLLLPEYFHAGSAWGEWSADEVNTLVGYIPAGLGALSSLWNAPLPDYTLQGWEPIGIGAQSILYVFSALMGVVATVFLVLGLGKWLAHRND